MTHPLIPLKTPLQKNKEETFSLPTPYCTPTRIVRASISKISTSPPSFSFFVYLFLGFLFFFSEAHHPLCPAFCRKIVRGRFAESPDAVVIETRGLRVGSMCGSVMQRLANNRHFCVFSYILVN